MRFVSAYRNLVIGILLAVIACMLFYACVQVFNVADEQTYLAELARTPLTDSELLSNSLHRWASIALSLLSMITGFTSYLMITGFIEDRRSNDFDA